MDIVPNFCPTNGKKVDWKAQLFRPLVLVVWADDHNFTLSVIFNARPFLVFYVVP